MDVQRFIEKLKLKPGASESMINIVESKFGIRFPDDYRKFLFKSNGASGFVGKSYLLIWSLEEMQEMNRLASVNKFAPGLILVGSDGGGMSYAFDARKQILSFVEVPSIGMSIEELKVRGSTYHEFLEYLFNKD